ISIGEVYSPGAASADVGSGSTVGRFAKGLGCLRRHVRWLDHHRDPRYVAYLLGRQTARREMGSPKKMSRNLQTDGSMYLTRMAGSRASSAICRVLTAESSARAVRSSAYGWAKIVNGGTDPRRLCRQRLKLIAVVSR